VSEHKQDDTFRVIDRRLFTAEGELRQEAVEEERKQDVLPKPAAPSSSTATAPPAANPASGSPAPANEPPPSPAFKNLLAFLARNAEMVLGGLPDPRTGRTVIDLESLRQLIDMMEVLRDKTNGNLASEDAQLLGDVIGDLKYSFLQVQQQAVAASAPGKGRKP
jgi:3-oxoacyl-ACP reductase-like protein